MASLETISIEINANSQKASQGLSVLTGSLRSMSKAMGTAAAAANSLNRALKQLQQYSKTKIPNIVPKIGTANNPLTNPANNNKPVSPTALPTTPQNSPTSNVNAGTVTIFERLRRTISGIGQESENAAGKAGTLGKTLNQIGRIGKMMLIRTAIRSLIKGFQEAWQSAYQFSKAVGGDFAKNVDIIRASLKSAAINLVSSFAPALSAIVPIVNVVANAIKFLCDMIQRLLSMLGIASEMFGASAETVASYGSSTSGSAKNVLAAFDELNVIDAGGGGGGGGGSSPTAGFADMIGEELAAIQAIVGESLIAIGLILAFSGHIPIGVGLVAVGAAALVQNVTTNWGKLTDDVKTEVTNIMIIAGGAMLALGAIIAFACPAKLGLGIALMVAGAASMATAIAVSWSLSDTMKKQVGKVTAIVGGALLAIGAILCFSGASIPLGIALMAAGGVSLVAAAALNWSSLKDKIKKVFGDICDFLKGVWNAVSNAVTGAWESVKTWAEARWANISSAWETIKNGLCYVWNSVTNTIRVAWTQVKDWMVAKWSSFSSKWEDIKKGFTEIWGLIGTAISDAWANVKTWIEARWTNMSQAWDGIKNGLVGRWDAIKLSVSEAWKKVSNWFSAKWSTISQAWDTIKQGLVGRWDSIKLSVEGAWKSVTNWLNTKWASLSQGWDDIKNKLVERWGSIKSSVSDAWKQFSNWVNAKWSNMSDAWENIRKNLSEKWTNIKSNVSNAWDEVKKWWTTNIVQKIENAWSGISGWFKTNVTDKISSAFKDAINWIIDKINIVIGAMNKLGKFTIPGLEFDLPFGLGHVVLWNNTPVQLWNIPTIAPMKAAGDYNIPNGQMFIAREAGPELVGKMGSNNSVANNQQIVDGISNGVREANAEQNALLREQNNLLMGILQKTGTVNFGASSAFGRTVRKSLDMYDSLVGG